MNLNKIFTACFALFALASSATYAQQETTNKGYWYTGLGYSIPLMYGDVQSITHSKTSLGSQLNLNVGYKFSPFFALEGTLGFGKMKGYAPSYAQDFYLGNDAMTYYGYLVLGGKDNFTYNTEKLGLWNKFIEENTTAYTNLYTSSSFFSASLKGVFNLNRLVMEVPASEEQVVTALLKPGVYLQKYTAQAFNLNNNEAIALKQTPLSVGLGADVALQFNLSKKIALELSSGLIWVSAQNFDGIKTVRRSNDDYIINTGLTFTYKFNNAKPKAKPVEVVVAPVIEPIVIQEPVAPVVEPKEDKPAFKNGNFAFAFLTPDLTKRKVKKEDHSAYINFAVSSSVINPSIGKNQAELLSLYQELTKLTNDQDIVLDSINMVGWASPEGNANSNLTLSQNRALALAEYIATNYGYPQDKIKATGKGEDWATFKTKVEQWESVDQSKILAIINSYDDLATKKKKMYALPFYKILVSNIFPMIRRNDYTFHYTVVPFTIERMKELIDTNPGKLTEDEFVAVINTYPLYSGDFIRYTNLGYKHYPNSAMLKVYKAAIALQEEKTGEALTFLQGLDNEPLAWNLLGVTYELLAQKDKALSFFNKAAQNGDAMAAKNLNLLQKATN